MDKVQQEEVDDQIRLLLGQGEVDVGDGVLTEFRDDWARAKHRSQFNRFLKRANEP